MKRRLYRWIAIAALAMRMVAPLAAIASELPSLGFNEICSASSKASSSGESQSPPIRHPLSLCTDCPCGTTVAVLPSAFVLPLVAATGDLPPPLDPRPPSATAPNLFPPPRGPPAGHASA